MRGDEERLQGLVVEEALLLRAAGGFSGGRPEPQAQGELGGADEEEGEPGGGRPQRGLLQRGATPIPARTLERS